MGLAWWRTTCWVAWHQRKLSRWRSLFTIIVVKTWRLGLPRVGFARCSWQRSRTMTSIGLAVPSRNAVRNYWWNALGMTFNFFCWGMCGPFEVACLDGMEVISISALSSRRRRTWLIRTTFAIPLLLQCRSCRTTCIRWRIRSCCSPSMEWSRLQQWTFCKVPHGCCASDAGVDHQPQTCLCERFARFTPIERSWAQRIREVDRCAKVVLLATETSKEMRVLLCQPGSHMCEKAMI